jgi:superfamily II DNA or RNA helicase
VKFLTEKLSWYSVHRSLESYVEARKNAGPKDHRILVLNPEQVTPILSKLRKIHWDRIIWDEAQRLKNRASRSSRDAALLAKSADRRLALTGTPMDLDPKDLWAIMRFVMVTVFGDRWKDFETEFLEEPKIDLSKPMRMIERQRKMLAYQIAKRKAPMRKDMLDEFARRCNPHVMRISKEDAGIEAAKVTVIRFNLDPQEEKKYKQLERHMVVKHKGIVVKTPLKITQIGKLQQITGGYLKDEEGEVHCIGTTKRRKLRSAIRENVHEESFVVFCKYVWEVHMVARVLRRMGYSRTAELWGKVKDLKKDKRRTNMLLAFQRGEYDAMVCQQRTGGVGVDLYRARKFFVYSMGHSFIDFDQMVSRGDFLDQSSQAEFFLLAVRSSIDTDIISAVRHKKSITEQFYDRLNRQL